MVIVSLPSVLPLHYDPSNLCPSGDPGPPSFLQVLRKPKLGIHCRLALPNPPPPHLVSSMLSITIWHSPSLYWLVFYCLLLTPSMLCDVRDLFCRCGCTPCFLNAWRCLEALGKCVSNGWMQPSVLELETTIGLLPKGFQLSILMDSFHGNEALIIIKANQKISSAFTNSCYPSKMRSSL